MTGVTLRDYFAAQAIQAVYKDAMQEAREGSGLFSEPNWRIGIAIDAYAMADAMMSVGKDQFMTSADEAKVKSPNKIK